MPTAAIIAALGALAWIAIEIWKEGDHPTKYSFSLRVLMVAMSIASVAMALVVALVSGEMD